LEKKVLGRGHHSEVRTAKEKETNQKAVKIFRVKEMEESELRRVEEAIKLWSGLSHPAIVQL